MQAPTELINQLCTQLTTSERSDLPRYKQLYEALRQQIIDGFLLPGMCLPSSRIISQQLEISRNTVLAAIEQLCAEGYAVARPKSGIYILSTAPNNHNNAKITSSNRVKRHLSVRGNNMFKLAQTMSMRGAFAVGVPDLQQFPYDLWQRYVSRYARNPKLDWQAHPQQGGDLELRQALADYLRIVRSIRCDPKQILITHGTQHSLQLVADLLADPTDQVWVEDPGYIGARCAFHAAGLTVVNQPVDNDGLSPIVVPDQPSPRLIYTTPSHQYPTGVVMSAARRRQLLALAAAQQSWIIEDDYDSEFRYEGSPLAALHALAPEQVIYLGTFSKTLFPSLHLGYMVLPAQFEDAFRLTQVRHQREPSYVLQKTLADFIRDGHFSTHIRKMRREYQSRRDILVELLHRELGELIHLGGIDTGLHLVAHLPTALNDQEIATKAYQQGVVTAALTPRYYSTSQASGLLLGFGDAHPQNIPRAGKVLAEIILREVSKIKQILDSRC